eukprot:g17202.t3
MVEVCETTDGRGKCLIARAFVEPGGLILAETPLFVKPEGWTLLKLQRMPPAARARMLKLAQASHNGQETTLKTPPNANGPVSRSARQAIGGAASREEGALLRVLRANGLQSLQGTSVCDLISRANHSCRPNATLCPEDGDGEESGIIRLVASTSLKPGDEVLISYLSGEDEAERIGSWPGLVAPHLGTAAGAATWALGLHLRLHALRRARRRPRHALRALRSPGRGGRGDGLGARRVSVFIGASGSGCHFPHPDGRWTNCTACGLAAGEGARSFEEVEDDWHQAAWLCLTASETLGTT